ncbi:MAG: hypothetical protein V8R51_07315 [Clostridia bacterium]
MKRLQKKFKREPIQIIFMYQHLMELNLQIIVYSSNTNENNTIKIRNVKNHNKKSKKLSEIVKRLPAMKRVQNIPYISEKLLQNIYVGIYQNEDISLFDRITNNPSLVETHHQEVCHQECFNY